jgi:signal transduction histidine kinase
VIERRHVFGRRFLADLDIVRPLNRRKIGDLVDPLEVRYPVPNSPLGTGGAVQRRTLVPFTAAIALVGLLTAGSLRRQARLARLKTDLVATVSHELKTPLASMRLLLETLLEDGFGNQKAAREYIVMISHENQRLCRLIDNFLTFSRIERNRRTFDFAETTAEEVIAPAMAAMQERLRATRSKVDVAVSPDLPPVWADRDALVTVVLNLLDNAYKYTPAKKEISVRASCECGHLVFAVKDNGIGIAPREQKRIFRKFYQVDRRLARESGGCGLGLTIVDFVVRAHGGSVQVKSALGAGSTFRVLLPCDADGREAHA